MAVSANASGGGPGSYGGSGGGAGEFNTAKEKQIWEDLLANLQETEQLRTPQSATRLLGTIVAAMATLDVTAATKEHGRLQPDRGYHRIPEGRPNEGSRASA